METRLYYLLGDLFSCVLVAVLVAMLCATIFPVSWPMPLLMLVSMFVGMVAAFVLNILAGLIYFFGAMEIMVPTMLTGMFAGMYGVMYVAGLSTEENMNYSSLFVQSAMLGVVSSIVVRIYSILLSGKKQFS